MPDAALTDREVDEALYHFGNLLRCDTSNPPGNEASATRYLAGVLAADGIAHEIVEPAPGRTSLVARLSAGRPQDGLLLSAHVDVVPATGDGWTHPPFEGRVADGFLWGRGALDMKHMATMSLMAMLIAHRRGLRLSRDLAFAAVADEEQGCRLGSLWLAQHRPDLIQSRWCLTEAGGFTLQVGETVLVPVQIATKGFAWVRVTAVGAAGHGSLPDADGAPWRLLRALRRIESGLVEQRLCPEAVAFLDAVAAAAPGVRGALVHGLKLGGGLSSLVRRLIPDRDQARYFAAITHDTAALTMLRGSDAENVVPDRAEALLDLRVLPGRRVAEAVERLAAILGDDVRIEVIRSAEPTVSEYPTPLWDRIEATVAERLPGARVVPYLMPGFADVVAYAGLGITSYGFAPVALPPGMTFARLVHAPDERIPVDGFRWGLETLLDVVFRFCGDEGTG